MHRTVLKKCGELARRSVRRSLCSNNKEVPFPSQYTGAQLDMPDREQNARSDPSWSAQQRMMTDRIFFSPRATSEIEIRNDLRTAHRLCARYGFDDLVWNHMSARCAGAGIIRV